MESPKKRIAVVGAGISGLSAVIMMKEEGMEPDCFEKTDKPGGTWCYREEPTVGNSSIMPTTIINISKELGAISNFPPDKNCDNYMKHSELYKYMMSYWIDKGALKHVKYNSEITVIKQAVDYEETGRWVLTVKNRLTDTISSYTYDSVVVCSGYLGYPKMPTYKGQNQFKGQIIHSHSLKEVYPYKDKKVVVVGMGSSALDAAVETSNVAQQVYLSTRSGSLVLTRVGPHGYPMDTFLLRRYWATMLKLVPTNILSWLMEKLYMDSRFNTHLYPIQPKGRFLYKTPPVSDYLFPKLLSGSIIQKNDILEFCDNGVIFDGDSEFTEADVVIMATGYHWKFPFFSDDLLEKEEDQYIFYKEIWPPHLKYSTLAFVGFVITFGAIFPAAELQSRFIAQTFSGKKNLPSQEKMLKSVRKQKKKYSSRFIPCPCQPSLVDYIEYSDQIAKQINAKPSFFKLFFTDPRLFCKLQFGPSVPYQYRLQGPHPWNGARDAIMTSHERMLWPLRRMAVKKLEPQPLSLFRHCISFCIPSK